VTPVGTTQLRPTPGVEKVTVQAVPTHTGAGETAEAGLASTRATPAKPIANAPAMAQRAARHRRVV
jgi:hypothetical protein